MNEFHQAIPDLGVFEEYTRKHRILRFTRAFSMKETLIANLNKAEKAEEILRKWKNLIVEESTSKYLISESPWHDLIAVKPSLEMYLANHIFERCVVDHNRRSFPVSSYFQKSYELPKFKASIKVPPNPPHIILDFISCNAQGEPVAVEGHLKKRLIEIHYTKAMAKDQEDAWDEILKNRERFGEMIVKGKFKCARLVGYRCFWETLPVSLMVLDNKLKDCLGFLTPMSAREMFRALCVLRKQQRVPIWFLQVLWRLDSEEKAKEVMLPMEQGSFLEVSKSNVAKQRSGKE